jgi:uncharacterized membrane protein YjjB (DUF3815 family)
MQIFAFLLALAATVLFLVEWYTVTPPRRPLPLGLACLTIAWMVQLIVLTGSHIKME